MSRPYNEWLDLARRWDQLHYPWATHCLCPQCAAKRAKKEGA